MAFGHTVRRVTLVTYNSLWKSPDTTVNVALRVIVMTMQASHPAHVSRALADSGLIVPPRPTKDFVLGSVAPWASPRIRQTFPKPKTVCTIIL
ncbi:MAG: hypothetical protein WCI01_08305 [Chlorobiaceae bacterium]